MKKIKLFALSLAALMLLSACAPQVAAPSGTPTPAVTPSAEPSPTAQTPAEYTADVVVIGAGGAGMAAAIEAADKGASVVILEKMTYAGGNTVRSEGGMNAAETVFQQAKDIADTKQAMYDDTFKGGKELSNPEILQYFVDNSAPTIDWLTSLGMDVSDVGQGAGAAFARMHRPADGSKIGGVLVPVLMENLAKRNITILYSTKAVELIKEGDAVTGVIAENKDGEKLTFKSDAVVLATGGFGANEELYVKYRSDLAGFATTNHAGATGDGIILAEAVGAATVDTDQIQTNPTVEPTTNIVISESVRGKGAIFVNQSGVRFTSEMLTRDVLSTAILTQPEKYAYMILDQAVMDSMAALQENYERGIITKGETLTDLADTLGMDATALEGTIATWNKAVADKKDAEFGRETGMDADLSHAPYYAIKVTPAVHYTMGGVKFDTETRVIDTAGKPIPGLYAAGEVTGGLHGGNRLGGNAVADIMIFGRQAGAQSAALALGNGKTELIIPAEGAAVKPEVQGDYKDGTYTGSAAGRNGEIKVTVVVSGKSITEIKVDEHQETDSMFAGVERDMIPQIIRTQSVQVDNVAGATISSDAVKAAVESAISSTK